MSSGKGRRIRWNQVVTAGGRHLRGGSILCYSSSQNSLSPAESQGYFKPLRVGGTPLLIEMTVLKVPWNEIPSLESDCQLSVERYGKCKADGKFSKNASTSSGKYRSRSACSSAQENLSRACCPQTGPQPCPRTLGDILNLSIDGEYYLHVHSSGLLPSAFSQQFKHSDRASSALLKRTSQALCLELPWPQSNCRHILLP